MFNSWAKVRSFLDTMNVQDLHSALPSSYSSFSHSSSSSRGLQPLSIETIRWDVGERTAQQILSVIQPNEDSEDRRTEIIAYLQTLIENTFGIKVFPFGSVPLKTYLPHGDIDLTIVNPYGSSEDLATDICSLLEYEERNNPNVQVRDVLCVPAQVGVVKCTVGGICVDISFNQKAGLCAVYFLEQVDRFIGQDHLFKRSVILIKAWCYYESRILGGFYGLISTYALEIMVLHVVNLFHSSLQCPLAVLYKFLEYFSIFDWNKYGVAINGIFLVSSLPEIVVQRPSESDDLLLTDTFVRRIREAVLSSMGVVGPNPALFSLKCLNILDPLRDDNNLGRSVGKGNFRRIRSALSYGAGKLGSVLMLPLENISTGLEGFFKDTIERNGKGRRADTTVPVSTYGSEMSYDNSGSDLLLSGANYGLWFNGCGVMYPAAPQASESHQVWNNGWANAGHNARWDQKTFNNFNRSPCSFDGVTSFATSNAAHVIEKCKSKGTGTFFPHIDHLHQRNMVQDQSAVQHESWKKHVNVVEHDIGEEYKIEREVDIVESPVCTPQEVNSSPDEAANIDTFSFSIEEFPVLPGSKPIPIKVSPSFGSPEPTLVKEPSASLDYSLELDSFKHSSPTSLVSEVGKQSVSDVSVILDLVGDSTNVTVPEDQELSKSEEKLVVPEQPILLADDMEFPPLSRPPEPVIVLNKKEFPPLRSCLKSQRKPKWRKDPK